MSVLKVTKQPPRSILQAVDSSGNPVQGSPFNQTAVQVGVPMWNLRYLANPGATVDARIQSQVPTNNRVAAAHNLGLDTWQQRWNPNLPLDKNFVPKKTGTRVYFNGSQPTIMDRIRSMF